MFRAAARAVDADRDGNMNSLQACHESQVPATAVSAPIPQA